MRQRLRHQAGGRGGKLVHALADVALEIQSSQFATIVCPSGCGKSALLRVAAGAREITSGDVMPGKEHIKTPGPDRGMVFQSHALFPMLTVRKNVAFGPRLAAVPTKEWCEQSDFLLNRIGLSSFADTFPKESSVGMKQRVAIARAVAIDPRILLMDEPFGALDSEPRGLLQELFTPVWAETTKQILFVNHDIEEADFVGQRIFVMSAHPDRIKEVEDFDLPYPQGIETLSEPKCVQARQHVLSSVHDEVFKAHEAA